MDNPRSQVLAAFTEHRCSAILRTPLAHAVAPAMAAAVEAGFRIIEFTLNTPDALEHIRAFRKHKELVVGAGTVLTMADAEAALDAGAQFLVSPVTDPEIIAFARDKDLVSVPGTATPTEMLRAHNAGADLLKLFPCPANGPAFVRACLGPMPFLRIFPTSGVTPDNAAEFHAAGAFGLGWVAPVFDPEDMAAGNWSGIRERARIALEASRKRI